MNEIKKINVFSLSKIFALFGILFGLLSGIYFGFLSSQYKYVYGQSFTFDDALIAISSNPALGFSPFLLALGWFSIIVSPIIFAIIYFISGAVISFLYNLFAKFFGGVKIVFAEKKK